LIVESSGVRCPACHSDLSEGQRFCAACGAKVRTDAAEPAVLTSRESLAAVLAEGGTPTPELVAAAGGEGATLSSRAAIFWFVVAAALLLIVTILTDRVSLVGRVPLTKSADVLADRAEELRDAFGYAGPAADRALGFEVDAEYLEWAAAHGSGAAGWSELIESRPAAVRFFYRTSPRVMVPANSAGSSGLTDPPFNVTGMTIVQLDPIGRLLKFEAMPRQLDPSLAFPAPTVDWLAIVTTAGFDPSTLEGVTPGRTPRTFADSRHAWRGLLPGTTHAVTIEAASYRGRPVYFEVIGPWSSAPRDPGAEPGRIAGTGRTVLAVGLVLAAAAMARANFRRGRADRRGAARIATFTVGLAMAGWVLMPHVRDFDAERVRLLTTLGVAMLLAGVLYLLYLAVEPYVRRGWPAALVGWSRLLSGLVRDAVVGRELLIGIACGIVLALLDRLNHLAPAFLGWPEPVPPFPDAGALLDVRQLLTTIVDGIGQGLRTALVVALQFAVARWFVHRIARRWHVRQISIDVVAAVLVIVVVMLFGAVDSAAEPDRLWLPVLVGNIELAIALLAMTRVGVLAAAVMYAVRSLLNDVPLTLDVTRFYAGGGWFVLLSMLILAALGLWWARAGQPLFGVPYKAE
jgi:hypothetical protein